MFESQNHTEFCVSHFLGRILSCAYTIGLYGHKLLDLPGDHLDHPVMSNLYSFYVIYCIHLLCD